MRGLKEIRKAKGITQQSLAEKSGVNIRQIQRIEAGGASIENITLKNAAALADALEIPIEGLLKKEDASDEKLQIV